MPVFDGLYIDNMRNDVTFTVSSIFPLFPSMACFLFLKYNYDKIKIPNKVEKIMAKIANVSLYIYMVHVIILEYVNKHILEFIPATRFLNSIILIILVLIITLILSFIAAIIFDFIYKWISKQILKLHHKLKKVK